MAQLFQIESRKKYFDANLVLIPLFIFPIFPLLAIFISVLIIISNNEVREKTYYILFFLLALYLGLINGTKVPDNDMVQYLRTYNEVRNFSFVQYIFLFGKEPGFFIYNYIIYITGASFKLYIIITSFICYFLLFIAIYKYYNVVLNKNYIIIFSIVLMAVFPQLFSLSAQVIRQFMAASVLIYAMILKFFYKKKVWYLFLIAVFIHSTTLFFIPFIYFNPLKKRFSLKIIIYIAFFVLIIISFLPVLTNWLISLMGNNFLTYAFNRASKGTTFYLKPIPLIGFIFMFILIIIILRRQYQIRLLKVNESQIQFSNIYLILSLFILLNLNMLELSVRFFFFTYFFFPFFFPLFFLSNKVEYKVLRIIITTGFILFFIYRLKYGTWQYAPLPQLLFPITSITS